MALPMRSQPCHKKYFLACVVLCLFHIFAVVDGQAAFQAYSGNKIVIVDNGRCFQSARYGSSNYGNHEWTRIKVLRSGTLNVLGWSVEGGYDYLSWPGNSVSSNSPHGRSVAAGNYMTWDSDWSVTYSGFKVCLRIDDCTHVSGNNRNSQDCNCGTAACTANTGRYCISSSSSCFTCLVGRRKQSADSCTDCTPGFYQNQRGSSTTCKSCPKGFYQNSNQATSCTSCVAGKYGNQNQLSQCKACPKGYYQTSNQGPTSCTSCGAGRYSTQSSAVNNNGCKDCVVGKFSTSVGTNENTCTFCGLGKFSADLGRATDCTSCVPGRYIDQTGQTSCKLCGKGKHNLQSKSESSAACLDCAAGSFNDVTGLGVACKACSDGTQGTGKQTCLGCSPGKRITNPGTCTDCLAGQYSFYQDSAVCNVCPKGYYAKDFATSQVDRHDSCSSCPRGKFGDVEQATTLASGCKPCVAGRFSDLEAVGTATFGTTYCKACATGKWSDLNARDKELDCTACATGRYSTTAASNSVTHCKTCNSGLFLESVGSSAASACKSCPAGFHQNIPGSSYCLPCGPGTRQNNQGSVACISCAVGTASSAFKFTAQSCPTCAVGKKAATEGSASCQNCEAGKYGLNCKLCERGKYRASATDSLTSCLFCGVGFQTSMVGMTSCSACIPGRFATQAGASACSECVAGQFVSSVASKTCFVCPVGFVQPEIGKASCLPCEAGKFQNETTRLICKPCSRNSFRAAGDIDKTRCVSCPSGWVSGTGLSTCTPCAAGKHQNLDLTSATHNGLLCIDCAIGTYQALTGNTSCVTCPPGWVSGTGASTCTPCAAGKHQNLDLTSATHNGLLCIDCAIGTYQALTGGTSCATCPSGWVATGGMSTCSSCPRGKHESNLTCTVCTSGKFQSNASSSSCADCASGLYQSSSGATMCSQCQPGKYGSNPGSTVCQNCLGGKFSSAGQTACLDCEAGYFQENEGQGLCLPCVPGRYQDTKGRNICLFCSINNFSSKIASTSCEICSPGRTSATGSASCSRCGTGTINKNLANTNSPDSYECEICIKGRYAQAGDLECKFCESGFYQTEDSKGSCEKCPYGKYLTTPGAMLSGACKSCPVGTYNGVQGASSRTSCNKCPPGKASKVPGATRADACINCPSGYASIAGMEYCTICGIGKIAPAPGSATCQSCGAGKYGLSCKLCDQGTYRASSTDDPTFCTSCPAGYHQNSRGNAACLPCIPGKYNGVDRQQNCTDCEIDTYSDRTLQLNCTECAIGRQAKWRGAASCESCSAGFYGSDCSPCAVGQFRAGYDLDASICDVCPAGYSQPANGQPSCLPCIPGKHQFKQNTTECLDCALGKYTDNIKSEQCVNCPRGTQATSEGTAECTNCLAGTYGVKDGESCEKCAPGQYRSGNDKNTLHCNKCPQGFKQGAPGQPNCFPCSAGKFQLENGSLSCLDCLAGQFRGNEQTDLSTCLDCPSGYANKHEGQAACFPCDAGTSGMGCSSCLPGRYRGNEDENLKECIDCPSGFHSNDNGQPFCKECDAGKFQDRTAQLLCKECVRGKYQESKKRSDCDLCKIGTFQDVTDQNICKSCPASATTVATGASSDYHCLCKKGTFATRDIENENKLSCVSCPPRSTTLSNNKTSSADCVCADQFWKPNTSASTGSIECLSCPVHSVCQNGQLPFTLQGYWRVPWREENTKPSSGDEAVLSTRLKCLEETACIGFVEKIEQEGEMVPLQEASNTTNFEGCLKFHAGPLCAACVRGSYKKASSYLCLECYDSQNDSILFLALALTATVVIIGVMTIATVADGGQASTVDVVIIKIAFNSGIISAGASAFPLSWPPVVVNMFQMYAVGSATVIGDSLSTDCVLRDSQIRPVQAWSLAAVSMPPAIILIWYILFKTCNVCNTTTKQEKVFIRIHYPVAKIVTLIFAHPVVTKAAIKLVACRSVAGKRYMDADFNIACNSQEYAWWALSVALPLFIVYTFGVPFVYGIVLYRHVKKKTLKKNREIYGFLFSGFRSEIWWFELWNTLRKSLFTIVAVLFRPSGAMLQTWAALVLLLMFIVIFSLASPYEHAYLNRLESWALSINVVTLLLGLGLFTNDKAGEDKSESFAQFLTVIIILLNSMFGVTVIWTLIRSPHAEYCRYCTRCKRKHKVKKIDAHVYAAFKMRNNVHLALVKRAQTLTQTHKDQADKHKDELDKHKDELDKHKDELDKHKNELDKHKDELNKQKHQLDKHKQKSVHRLIEKLKMSRTRSSRSRQVESIMKTSDQNRTLAVESIKTRQMKRRSSLLHRVQKRNAAKGYEALQKCALFSNLSKKAILKIVEQMEQIVADPGEVICSQGEVAETFYVVIRGHVNVSIDGKQVAVLSNDDVFGETALINPIDEQPLRNATVTVDGGECAQLLALTKHYFDLLLKSHTFGAETLRILTTLAENRANKNELVLGAGKKKSDKHTKTNRKRRTKKQTKIQPIKATGRGENTETNKTKKKDGFNEVVYVLTKICGVLRKVGPDKSKLLCQKISGDSEGKMTFDVFYGFVLFMNKKIGFKKKPDKDQLKKYWLSSMPEAVLNETDDLRYIDQIGLMKWAKRVKE